MADCEQVWEDEMTIYGPSWALGVDTPIPPPWTGVGEAGPTSSKLNNGCQTSSLPINYEASDDTRYSPLSPAWNGPSSTSNFVLGSNDACVLGSWQSIGAEASPFVPGSLIETPYCTQEDQTQDDFSLKYIDPRLLYLTHPTDNTPIETCCPPTVDAPLDLGPPTAAPAAYHDESHVVATPAGHQAPSVLDVPAHNANRPRRQAPSRRGEKSVRIHDSAPRHKKRRAHALGTFDKQPLYHSLSPPDREYFDQVIAKLQGAPCLVSPQTLEPKVGTPAGLELVGLCRSTGPGAAADHESVYVILVDRSAEGVYMCWICGEKRVDRRLPRALDHIRGHFEHHPYHCFGTHCDPRTVSGSPLSLASVCGQSFSCSEALKDHQTKMKNKSHPCSTCGKVYANSANVKRHMRKEHPA